MINANADSKMVLDLILGEVMGSLRNSGFRLCPGLPVQCLWPCVHPPSKSRDPSQLQPASFPLKALYLVIVEACQLGKALKLAWNLALQDLGKGEGQPQSPPRAHPSGDQAPEGQGLTEE